MREFNYEIIQQYISGELKGEDLLAFEEQLKKDSGLADEVTLYKNIDQHFTTEYKNKDDENKLVETLKHLSNKHLPQKATKVISLKKYWWLGATAAAAIFLFIFNPWKKEIFTADSIYASNIDNFEKLSPVIRGTNTDSLKQNAAKYYNIKEFEKALPILSKICAADSSDKSFLLAKGVCHLQTMQYDSANKIFNELSNGNTVLKYEGVWYLALSMLKQQKINECTIYLNTLPQTSNRYNESVELLSKLKKLK